MQSQLMRALLFGVLFLLLLAAVELIHKRLRVRAEVTRKTAHFVAAASTLCFPYLFTVHWYVLALAVLFFLLLLASRNTGGLSAIHDINRDSAGSFLLPVGLYLPFLIGLRARDSFLFTLPILILAISDPLAGLVGMHFQGPRIAVFSWRTRKTWPGSSAFFGSSLLISLLAVFLEAGRVDAHLALVALCVAAAATVTELLSPLGTDNLAVPLVSLAVLWLFRHGQS